MASAAFDGDVATAAVLTGNTRVLGGGGHVPVGAICTWFFDSLVLSYNATLSVTCAAVGTGATDALNVIGNIGGTQTFMAALTATTASATYTLSIPAGTDLGTVSVYASAGSSTAFASAELDISEIWIE